MKKSKFANKVDFNNQEDDEESSGNAHYFIDA